MAFTFHSGYLRLFNNRNSYLAQLQAVQHNYVELLAGLEGDHPSIGPFFDDLNAFLHAVEEGGVVKEDEFKSLAPICVLLSTGADHAVLGRLFALNSQEVGTFLMLCMRVNNRATHKSDQLADFKALYDAVGITVSGDWEECVRRANFSWTVFAGTTLEVAISN